jgi:threonylcarbamoyladenosine tRNA methylthiotransferase MtaB
VNKFRKIAFHTLGCKLNFAETSTIARQLMAEGYHRTEFHDNPDIFLINTCSVTENADKECRTIVNRALAVNNKAIIIVTGCFAQLKSETVANIPGVDLVLGANEKFNATTYLEKLLDKGTAQVHSCEIEEVNQFVSSWSEGERTRVFLKVQDGCDYNCSFCTIPFARGASRSQSLEKVLDEVLSITARGVKEIVLTGINLGDYGIYNPEAGKHELNFHDLASALDKLETNVRLRISSIEPNLLNNYIIDLVASSEKFVPHFHIPLQSGSDKILKRMRRRYLTALYRERVEYIKNKMPHCCIGVDVITGFPGETDQDFLETYNFLNELDISYLHVFTYSERANTPAIEMEDPVPMAIRKERNKMLRILSSRKLRLFYESQLGREMPVLFEADHKDGIMHGYTPNYIKVKAGYDSTLINNIMLCRLEEIDSDGDVTVSIYENIPA